MQLTPGYGWAGLVVGACCLGIAAGPAAAQPGLGGAASNEVNLDALGYADSDHVYAVTSQLSISRALDDDGSQVDAHAAVDVVSSASVDVVSTASYRFSEVRSEAALDAAYRLGDWLPSLGYRFSLEPDYRSHTAAAAFSKRLGTPDTVVVGGYALTLDAIGMVDTPASVYSEQRTIHDAHVGLTQVLGPRTLLRVGYALSLQRGYLSNPYRSVPLFTTEAMAAAGRDGVVLDLDTFDDYRLPGRPPEQVPDSRHRHAWAARFMRYLPSMQASLRLDYRFYADSWSVLGNTLEPAIDWQITDSWRLHVSARMYQQTGAAFWKREYVVDDPQEVPAIRTVDRALSPYYTLGGATRVEWEYGGWRVYLSGGAAHTGYLDYLFLDRRLALTTQLGARWRF